jgi:hypothetical protein
MLIRQFRLGIFSPATLAWQLPALLRVYLLEVSIMMNKFFCPVVCLLFAATLSAQSTPPATNSPAQQPAHRGGQENCMQQAGIDHSVMEQMRTIGHDARTQVESICSNSSLTAQQRQEQARAVRERAMEKRDSLMTPDQRTALRECQQQKSGNHTGEGGGMHEGAGGGCREMPRGASHRNSYPNGSGSSNSPSSNPPTSQN